MGEWLRIAVWSFVSVLRSRRDLALENVALRQQSMVLRRQPGHVRLKDSDRLFWSGSIASGPAGAKHSSSFNRPRSWTGIAGDSEPIGGGRAGPGAVDRGSTHRYGS